MTSKKLDLTQRAARLVESATKNTPPAPEVAEAPEKPAKPTKAERPKAVRVVPVRLSVDVSQGTHTWIRRTIVDIQEDLGLGRVSGADLARALLDIAQDDPQLVEKAKQLIASKRTI